jgi:hypothetical protein
MKNITPPPFTKKIGLSDQIGFFYTGEMSNIGAQATAQRAAESLKGYLEQKESLDNRLKNYREKIKDPKALANLEKNINQQVKPVQKSIDRLEKFLTDVGNVVAKA